MNGKPIRQIILGGAAFLAAAFAAVLFLPVQPHGRFNTPDIMNTADAYYELSGGKVMQVAFGGAHGRQGQEFRSFVADYYQEHGGWVAVTPDGRTFELRATLLSLQITPRQLPREAKTLYRYVVCGGR